MDKRFSSFPNSSVVAGNARQVLPVPLPVVNEPPETYTAAIEMPMVRETSEHPIGHVEINRLSTSEAQALLRIRLGLVSQGHRLANGDPVRSTPDALRFVLQQAAATFME